MPIAIKRAYEAPKPADGYRVLVDRLWPRGLTKEKLRVDVWMKDIAPSRELREWIHDDKTDWDKFEKRYFHELDGQPKLVQELKAIASKDMLTLVYAARDEVRNNAGALKKYLEQQ
jgi:uncharacterized protein YeaO (DUF488 family)